MNPKKRVRMQKALVRRQKELQAWIDGTAALFASTQTVKKKIDIAEKDIASLIKKLNPIQTPAAESQEIQSI